MENKYSKCTNCFKCSVCGYKFDKDHLKFISFACIIEIKSCKQSKSMEQNAYYWKLLSFLMNDIKNDLDEMSPAVFSE